MYCVLKLLWSKRMPLQLTIICLTYYLMFGFFLFNPFYISVFQPFFSGANLFCLFFRWLSWKQDHHSEGGMNWEGNTDIYTPPCVKQTASKTLLHNTGSSPQCPVTDGWEWVGAGRLKREGVPVYLTLIHRKRQWQATPVLLPGKSHWRRSLVGCSPWGP